MAERSRYDQKCKDCQESNFVEDRAAGDLICQVPQGNYLVDMRPSQSKTLRDHRAEASKCSFCRCAAWLQSRTSSMRAQSGEHLLTA